jgi:hypothetical protein
MKRLLNFLGILAWFLVCGGAFGQQSAYTIGNVRGVEGEFEISSYSLPATPTLVTNQTAYVELLVLTNTSSSAVNITVTSISGHCGTGGASPCTLVSPVASLPGGSTIILAPVLRRLTDGILWSASTAGVVDAYIRWRY